MDILQSPMYRNLIRLMIIERDSLKTFSNIQKAFQEEVKKYRDDNPNYRFRDDGIDLRIVYYLFKRAHEYNAQFVASQLYIFFREQDPNFWMTEDWQSLFLQILTKMYMSNPDPSKYISYAKYYSRGESFFINPSIFFTADQDVFLFILYSLHRHEPQYSLSFFEVGQELVDSAIQGIEEHVLFENLSGIFYQYYSDDDVLRKEIEELRNYASQLEKRLYRDRFVKEACEKWLIRYHQGRGNYAEKPGWLIPSSTHLGLEKILDSPASVISEEYLYQYQGIGDFFGMENLLQQLDDSSNDDNTSDNTGETSSEIAQTPLSQHLIPSSEEDIEKFRIYGPINHFISDHGFSSARMFLNRDFEESNIEDEQELQDWFSGGCNYCLRAIFAREHCVRIPRENGGWEGCFCCWNCARNYQMQEYCYSLNLDALMTVFERLLRIYGIYDPNNQ